MTTSAIHSIRTLIYFKRIFCPKYLMVGLVYCLKHLLYFDIPLMYYYINITSSMIFCLSSRGIYLSFLMSLSCSFLTIYKLFCGKILAFFVILSVILLPIKSPVASAFFELLSWDRFKCIRFKCIGGIIYYLVRSRSFWLYLLLKFLHIFYQYF